MPTIDPFALPADLMPEEPEGKSSERGQRITAKVERHTGRVVLSDGALAILHTLLEKPTAHLAVRVGAVSEPTPTLYIGVGVEGNKTALRTPSGQLAKSSAKREPNSLWLKSLLNARDFLAGHYTGSVVDINGQKAIAFTWKRALKASD